MLQFPLKQMAYVKMLTFIKPPTSAPRQKNWLDKVKRVEGEDEERHN